MTEFFKPVVVTANNLLDGQVVYLSNHHQWRGALKTALIVETQEQAEQLLAKAQSQTEQIVGPYLIEVSCSVGGTPRPTHLREWIRVLGSSHHPEILEHQDI
jgi:ABC-type Fe3+-hydroxamate transport system substrate-binding protein